MTGDTQNQIIGVAENFHHGYYNKLMFFVSQKVTVTADVVVLDKEHYHLNPLNLPMTLRFLINHA